MNSLMQLYKDSTDWINLLKDVAFFFGAIGIVRYLLNRRYERISGQIESNLRTRDDIETKLNEYVLEKHKNGVRSIGLRLVYWKNYPWKLTDDGYKQLLCVRQIDKVTLPSGWIDNTGINFEHEVWFSGNSIYFDTNGIFFLAPKGGSYKNFKELQDKCLVTQLPFSNIVNFDFKQKIEYEAIIYTKHRYSDFKKIYSDEYVCREKIGDDFFKLELSAKLQLQRYCFLNYTLLRLKLLFRRALRACLRMECNA